jgi:hypothetical protein
MRRISEVMIQQFALQSFQPVDISGREDIDHIAHGRERSLAVLAASLTAPALALSRTHPAPVTQR